ncbi:acyltransferase [Alloacidobacterium dinghuense]|uniref:Acyltransferase n=1 Tax=Alloacidobacterium dinghuense TaxID=2763107 RepID=A0A7G8BJI0_9BACT|nr:acyltransferase [Alloacidobacterium dinghuense]QNI32700.1 acyltransferase [Alloacidobacterium dinghuense]
MVTTQIVYADADMCSAEVTGRFYRPELDVLRFFAFFAVYLCHSISNDTVAGTSTTNSNSLIHVLAAIKDAGNFGVCLFFMLSAFLITELLRREQKAHGSIEVGAFYLRRMLRIWPLYFGITIVYFLGGRYFHAMRMESGRVLAYFFLAGNWYIALHPWIQTPLRSLWSISVEEQFYLAWPLLARFGGVRWLTSASIGVVPVSILTICVISVDSMYAHNTVWLNSFTQFQFFAWGALLALALNGGTPKIGHMARCASGCAGVGLWLLAAYATGIKRPGVQASCLQFCLGYELVASGCILLLLAALGAPRRRVPAWVIYLGKISFGLYVFHETAFLIVDEVQKHSTNSVPSFAAWTSQHSALSLILNKALAFCVTVLLAMLSYHFWESPFLRLKQKITRVQSRGT